MTLLAIVGPTAAGKTPLAVLVAHRLGAELLNADSRQVIRGLPAGTCAPTAEELRGIPCHLLSLREPGEPFTVVDWLTAAQMALADLEGRRVPPLLVGGTGLYVGALVDGFDPSAGGPPAAERRTERERLAASPGGLELLAAELERLDPDAAATVDRRNPRRLIRALEIVEHTGRPLRDAHAHRTPRPARLVGLDAPRHVLDDLIAARAERMVRTGALLHEVDSALQRGITRAALDQAGIGYREALALHDGSISQDDAIAAIAQRTRRYAKAQRTWFRRDRRIRWFERSAEPVDVLVDEVADALREDARAG